MSIQYLFNSSGNWLAFRIEKNVFDTTAKWIGWMPWGDDDVVTVKGEYLGTICPQDRIYHFKSHPYRGYPGYPGYPGFPGFPGYPGFAGYSPLPSGADDVIIPPGE